MRTSKEIRLLTQLLNKLPAVKQNIITEYQPWRDEVLITLEKLFSKNSTEYYRFFTSARSIPLYKESDEEQKLRLYSYLSIDEENVKSIIRMQRKKEELNKVLRCKRLSRFIKDRLIKTGHELKDFIATIIAKIVAEKSK